MNNDKKPIMVPISKENEDWMSILRKKKADRPVVSRLQKTATEMDVWKAEAEPVQDERAEETTPSGARIAKA